MKPSDEKEASVHSGTTSPVTMPGDRSWVIFIICLVIATILWFLNALSKNYTATIPHPVQFAELPIGKFIINNPPGKLNLKISAHGFALIRYKAGRSFSPLVLNVSELIEETPQASQGIYVIPTSNLREKISSQLNSELQLMDISPGVFTLVFDSLGIKQVPVAPGVQLDFRSRFGLLSDIVFTPSRVTITGPRNVIDQTDTIYTVPKTFRNLETSFNQEIALVVPLQIMAEPGKVVMSVPVDEFTEKKINVPVWVENQPDNLKIRLFPHEAEISFSVGLSRYGLIKEEDFGLYVSYEEISKKLPVLAVKVRKSPAGVKSVKIFPENVEYLIEKE